MYHLELAYRPRSGYTSDGASIAYTFLPKVANREEADALTEALCERLSTVYVNVWHEVSPDEDFVLISQCDGFHS